MGQLRQVLTQIWQMLLKLTIAQRLLIVSLVAVMAMALALVALYSSEPAMKPLAPGAGAKDQARVADFLDRRQVKHKTVGGQIMVPAEQVGLLRSQLFEEGVQIDDTAVMFNTLLSQQSWTMSRSQVELSEMIALQNELSNIVSRFRGVRRASVIIDAPGSSGLGTAVRRPTASATVFTSDGRPIDQSTVDSIAHLIAGAKAGLDVQAVRVIDGTRNTQHRARSDDTAIASTYLEHAAKVEDRVRLKLLDLLQYIGGAVVAVNAQVDVTRKESQTSRVLDVGKGSVTAPTRERTSERTEGEMASAAEAGVRSNVGLDINRSGGGGSSSKDKQSEGEMETEFGRTVEKVVDPRGMPTKINATIGVPRSYLVALWKRAQGAQGANAEPTDQDLDPLMKSEVERIRADVRPLVEASGEGGVIGGDVVVSVFPDVAAGVGVALAGVSGGGGGGGGIGSMLGVGGLVKNVALGALALVSLGMMLMMVRKTGKADPLPSAQELAGAPPILQRQSDLIGEADEAEAALTGIELTDDTIKHQKLLEQVEEMVRSKPDETATLLNRWITADT